MLESIIQQQKEQVEAYIKREIERFAEVNNITSDITTGIERQLDLVDKIKAAGYEIKLETGGYHDWTDNKSVMTHTVKFESL